MMGFEVPGAQYNNLYVDGNYHQPHDGRTDR